MRNLADIDNANDINNSDYLFEGAIVHLHPILPIFEGITFMARYDGKWQMFTCEKRLMNQNNPGDYTLIAKGIAYSFPKCVCKRVIDIK